MKDDCGRTRVSIPRDKSLRCENAVVHDASVNSCAKERRDTRWPRESEKMKRSILDFQMIYVIYMHGLRREQRWRSDDRSFRYTYSFVVWCKNQIKLR